MTAIKICGVRSVEDAGACVDAGADLVGLNFWPGSPRVVDEARAGEIVRAIAGRARVVGVFVDERIERIAELRERLGLDLVQLHGEEPPDDVAALAPFAMKAIRVGPAEAVLHATRRFSGELLLLDTRVEGAPGGTGRAFEWSLAEPVCRERQVLLAGGLGPSNVGDAIRAARPWGVDVASGVESLPGVKDRRLVEAFVAAVRAAV